MPTRAHRAVKRVGVGFGFRDLDNHRLRTLLHRGLDWHTPPAPSQAAHHAARRMTPGLRLHAQSTVSRATKLTTFVRGTVITRAGMLIMRSCRSAGVVSAHGDAARQEVIEASMSCPSATSHRPDSGAVMSAVVMNSIAVQSLK